MKNQKLIRPPQKVTTMNPRRIAGIFLVFAGLFLVVTLLYPRVYATLAPEPVMDPDVVNAGTFWLVIPKINVDSVVLGEVSRHTLNRAVAHLPGSGFPGQGTNTIIVGHQYNPRTSLRPKSSFGLLDELEEGDSVYVAYEGEIHTYLVTDKEILDADNPNLYRLADHERLTLLTCAPYFHETKRLRITALPQND